MQRHNFNRDETVEWKSRKCMLDSVYAKYGLPPPLDGSSSQKDPYIQKVFESTNRHAGVYQAPHPGSGVHVNCEQQSTSMATTDVHTKQYALSKIKASIFFKLAMNGIVVI